MAKTKIFLSIGQRFGRLSVSSEAYKNPKGIRAVACVCDCGAEKECLISDLSGGRVTSCGCAKRARVLDMGAKNKTHGHTPRGVRSPTYISWQSMIARCTNPKTNGFQRYGGRGISVCREWSGEDGFTRFLADMGERPAGTSLDRVDHAGHYCPENCRWATVQQQRSNRHNSVLITQDGRTMSAADWARELGVHRNNVLRRNKRGAPLA